MGLERYRRDDFHAYDVPDIPAEIISGLEQMIGDSFTPAGEMDDANLFTVIEDIIADPERYDTLSGVIPGDYRTSELLLAHYVLAYHDRVDLAIIDSAHVIAKDLYVLATLALDFKPLKDLQARSMRSLQILLEDPSLATRYLSMDLPGRLDLIRRTAAGLKKNVVAAYLASIGYLDDRRI